MIKYECDLCHNQFESSDCMIHVRFDNGDQKESYDICPNCKKKLKKVSESATPIPKFIIGEYVVITKIRPDGTEECQAGNVISVKLNVTDNSDELYYYDIKEDIHYFNIIVDIPESAMNSVLKATKTPKFIEGDDSND